MEAPEIASGVVEIKSIAREAGSRSKIAYFQMHEHVRPSRFVCRWQKGVRVTTVMSELNGDKKYRYHSLVSGSWNLHSKCNLPGKVLSIKVIDEEHKAILKLPTDQLSLAIGKGGQNVRLARKAYRLENRYKRYWTNRRKRKCWS